MITLQVSATEGRKLFSSLDKDLSGKLSISLERLNRRIKEAIVCHATDDHNYTQDEFIGLIIRTKLNKTRTGADQHVSFSLSVL